MEPKETNPVTQSKSIFRIVLGTMVVLMAPFMAMRFTNEVNWDGFDFAVAAALLLGTGLLYELTTGRASNPKYKLIIGAVLAVILLTVWAELAVGVFGTPFSGE